MLIEQTEQLKMDRYLKKIPEEEQLEKLYFL